MRISGTAGTVALLVALAALGGGGFLVKRAQENKKLELQRAAQETRLKTKEAEAQARDAEAKAKAAEERTAATRLKAAEADKAKAEAARDAARTEAANLKAKQAAAEAEAKKSAAAKAAADAVAAAEAQRAAAETVALKRAEAEAAKAAADLAAAADTKRIAEAMREKSENELKAAEANAAAERDRKLRLYQRAGTSRAEMLALQRAERMLALEEAGLLPEDGAGDAPAAPGAAAPSDDAAPAGTNAAVAVAWPESASDETPAGAQIDQAMRRRDEVAARARSHRAREYIRSFCALIDEAEREGRAEDARHHRRLLVALVPDYVAVFKELIAEARKAGRAEDESRHLAALLGLIPDWQRVAVFAQLVRQDEAYFSKALAGRVRKDEYVRAFRKLYDEARREKGDRDERDQKVAHVCGVLATYVPDYETSPDWK